jgi:hypothetical protein
MSGRTIHTGIRELQQMHEGDPNYPPRLTGDADRIRRPGGGHPPRHCVRTDAAQDSHRRARRAQRGEPDRCRGVLD